MTRPVLEVSPALLDLKFYVPEGGVTWNPVFTCTKLNPDGSVLGLYDFTGASAIMYVKDPRTGVTLDTLSSAVSGPGANRLVLGGALGTLQMLFPKAVTNDYAFGTTPFTSAVWDLSVTDVSGNEVPFFAGNFLVTPGV